jgi:hypothetical protein
MLVFRTDHTCRIHFILTSEVSSNNQHTLLPIRQLTTNIHWHCYWYSTSVVSSNNQHTFTSIIFWKFWNVWTFWKIKRWFYSKLKKITSRFRPKKYEKNICYFRRNPTLTPTKIWMNRGVKEGYAVPVSS